MSYVFCLQPPEKIGRFRNIYSPDDAKIESCNKCQEPNKLITMQLNYVNRSEGQQNDHSVIRSFTKKKRNSFFIM